MPRVPPYYRQRKKKEYFPQVRAKFYKEAAKESVRIGLEKQAVQLSGDLISDLILRNRARLGTEEARQERVRIMESFVEKADAFLLKALLEGVEQKKLAAAMNKRLLKIKVVAVALEQGVFRKKEFLEVVAMGVKVARRFGDQKGVQSLLNVRSQVQNFGFAVTRIPEEQMRKCLHVAKYVEDLQFTAMANIVGDRNLAIFDILEQDLVNLALSKALPSLDHLGKFN